MDSKTLIFTNDSCIGCNKCVKGCPVMGANKAVDLENDGGSHIIVDGSKCIHCGNCLKNCEHDARRFTDDLDDVVTDLKNGIPIVLLIAPSFFLSYPNECKRIITSLRDLGFKAVYDVSFGANITTWASVNYIKETGKTGLISSACPVIVDYIEKYKPSLIPQLLPVMSPAGSLMTYLKEYVYNSPEDNEIRYAFLGPCIGKHNEYTSYPDGSCMDYTFTFKSYHKFCKDKGLRLNNCIESECDELSSPGLGKLYPVPGGLRANLVSLLNHNYFIKQIEGPNRVYNYLDTYEKMMNRCEQLPFFVDILNCEGGCSEGVATSFTREDAEVLMTRIQVNSVENYDIPSGNSNKYSGNADARWKEYNIYFSEHLGLDPNMFMRSFNKNNCLKDQHVPEPAIDEIFRKMNKITLEDRSINCTSCGYKGCREMAKAIYYGYNCPENCVHYVKDTLINNNHQLEKLLRTITGSSHEADSANSKTEFLVQQISNALLEIENQREELDNSIGERTQLFASLTHELRTPLNAIVNMTDLLDTSNFNQEQLENINSIKTASISLTDTINEILDFSKLEAGKFNIVEAEYSLIDLLNEVSTIMNFRCINKKLAFNKKLDTTIPNFLIGDYKRIRQVMINLIGNAVKYTNIGGITIEAAWNKDLKNPFMTFSVTDTGMGIKEEDLPFIFDSYRQVNEEASKHIVGTGLGLSISKKITDAMDGDISVESVYGSGSTFYLKLPQKISDAKTIGQVMAEANENKGGMAKDESAFFIPSYKVLVVDDLPVNLHVARAFLDKYQIYVDIAESAKEALTKCSAMKYDIIFLDYMMPEMSGLELMRALRIIEGPNKETPIVYMSANDEQTFVNEIAADMIFQGYVEKPLQKEAVRDILLNLADPGAIIYDSEGFIPENEEWDEAVKNKDYSKYLELMAGLERYAQIHDPGRTLRLANKYRIMLQLGLNQVPLNNLSVIKSLCTILRKH